jgi:hypothetical protein
MKTCRSWLPGLLALFLSVMVLSQAAPEGWLTISRDNLCVTEGTIEKSGDRLHVSVPKMRAYVTEPTDQSAEVRFKYLGPTSKDAPLGSGIMRRQFGFKLHAQDPCNLVYAIWRIEPESKLVVSVKRNPSQHTSAECGNRGYQNIKPRKASPVPRLEIGQSHTLRAEMKGDELRVFVDNRPVWEGVVGSDAAGLDGPVGIRSDNAQLEFDLLARKSASTAGGRACKAVDSD